MAEQRKRFRRPLLGFLLLLGATIALIEFSDSDFLLHSKTYELIGYQEQSNVQVLGEQHVYKSKRFAFLPGNSHMLYVKDSAGRTLRRGAINELPLEASSEALSAPAQLSIEAIQVQPAKTTKTVLLGENHL